MATRIFRVDLSDGARDFKPVATEPGLPMLDRANANFSILQKWLGSLAAEPVWIGQDSINLFIVADEGRLGKVDVAPATKADLEGPLAADLKTLQARVKKAKPESATEQSLHRVVRQTVAQLANGLDAGGQDSFFFKYRRGKDPWKLVWCWGYQRTDQEPAVAGICTNPECHQLFVKRPQNKNRCPGCDETPSARRGGSGAGSGVFASRGVQIGGLAALAALALLLLFIFGGKQQLVVTPNEISGPAGSKIDYKVMSRRFFVFNSDVTAKALADAGDIKLVEFAPSEHYALGKQRGKTKVTFDYNNSKVEADISIGAPATPNSIVLDPKSLQVAIGNKGGCKATGIYDGDIKIDLTEYAVWEIGDPKLASVTDGEVEGFNFGTSTLIAKYRGEASDKYAEASIPLDITYGALEVSPTTVHLAIEQEYSLDIHTGDKAPVVLESSDPNLVGIGADNQLIGKAPGTTEVIVKQGDARQLITVHVKGSPYKSLKIIPSTIAIKTAEEASFKVVGITPSGKQVDIDADKLTWIKQPLADHANVLREELKLFGLKPTNEKEPQEITVGLGDLVAVAKVEVAKRGAGETVIGEFEAYPPIVGNQGGTVRVDTRYLGKGLVYNGDGSILIDELDPDSQFASLGLPKGTIITGVNGYGFRGGIGGTKEWLVNNRIEDGARIQYRLPGSREFKVFDYKGMGPVLGVGDWALAQVKGVDATAADLRVEIKLVVREAGKYRLLDAKDKSISDWLPANPKSTLTFVTTPVPRTAKDDYEFFLEREIDGESKKFQVPFSLRRAD